MIDRGKRSPQADHSTPSAAEHLLLECIRRAQQQYIDAIDARDLFNELLNNFLELTESGFGFIGEIRHDENGAPFLKSRALSNIAWNKATRALYQRHALQGMEFRKLDSLFGAVITSGEALIANDPQHDPRRGGTPKGHPAMDCFLGLPLSYGGQLIGMVGVANRPGGYDHALIDYLAPLLETTAVLIKAYHDQVQPAGAEHGLLEAQASCRNDSPRRPASCGPAIKNYARRSRNGNGWKRRCATWRRRSRPAPAINSTVRWWRRSPGCCGWTWPSSA